MNAFQLVMWKIGMRLAHGCCVLSLREFSQIGNHLDCLESEEGYHGNKL